MLIYKNRKIIFVSMNFLLGISISKRTVKINFMIRTFFHPQFHPSPLSSTHQFHSKGPLLFSPRNPLVPHQKPLSSTPKTPQFNTFPSVPHRKPLSSTPSQFHTEKLYISELYNFFFSQTENAV